jgi:hypothetical protein
VHIYYGFCRIRIIPYTGYRYEFMTDSAGSGYYFNAGSGSEY